MCSCIKLNKYYNLPINFHNNYVNWFASLYKVTSIFMPLLSQLIVLMLMGQILTKSNDLYPHLIM